ncbi:MAG: hypothetical protein V1794_03650 [Candidatus Glassbacteria bacterium]
MKINFFANRYSSPAFSGVYIIVAVLLAHALGLTVPGEWLLPFAGGVLFWLLFIGPLSRGDYRSAVRLALMWAGVNIVCQAALSAAWPGAMESHVLRGTAYRDEMFAWVSSGAGPEGDIRLFLPVHLRHFLVFCAVSVATGGLLGLVLGSILLGYMNFYVGSLISASHFAPAAILLAWPVWAVIRVVGFIFAGTALGGILVDRVSPPVEKKRRILFYLKWALILIAADIALKWALAGFYQGMLNSALTGRL